MQKEEVLKLLESLSRKDVSYNSGRVLSSMCTSPHPIAREVFLKFIETNLGDTGIFRGTKQIEELAIRELGRLLGRENVKGFIVSGGTEANLMALWVVRETSHGREIILPETAHFSFEKAAKLLGLKLVIARVKKDKTLDIGDVKRKLSKNTSALVGIAGTTEYGTIDDIASLSEIALEENIHLHVDAAFGGFVIPFLEELGYPARQFDFSLKGVGSITVDPHKMGLAPVPAGGILFRNGKYLKAVESKAPYLIEKNQYTIVGTRSGAGAASTLAVIKYMGREGYKDVVRECMNITFYLYKKLRELKFQPIKPEMNILVFTHPKVDRIAEKLEAKGWKISRTRQGEIRLVLMPHIKIEHAKELLIDLKDITTEIQ
ncbi:histidine decarboxylase [archaeon]|nr:histidine decarboxylase [archaeon]